MRKIIFTLVVISSLLPAAIYGQETTPAPVVPVAPPAAAASTMPATGTNSMPAQNQVSSSGPGGGFISGSFQSNTNFFIRDSSIGAANLPHYDNLKIGTDVWFNLNYTNEKYGLEVGVRFDAFLNSILRNPTVPYTGVGIGNFYVKKRFKDLTISAGYLYDQIGTGIIYRAYEERTLGIDNALVGGKVEYDLPHLHLKAFSGVQKNVFSVYNPIISGFNAESNFTIGKVTLQPSIGIINRSMDQGSYNSLAEVIKALPDTNQIFTPKHNVYAFSFYNTLTVGPVSWYVEACYKTKDAFYGYNTDGSLNKLINSDGNIEYSSLNISKKGFGATFLFKRTQNFTLRTSPNETLFQGLLNFEPPVSRENSLRLPSRYYASSLEQHELAFGTELTYTPSKHWSFLFNGSYINDLLFQKALIQEQTITTVGGVQDTNYTNHKHFFTEANIEARFTPNRKIQIEGGFQYIYYNRVIYQGDGSFDVRAYTPFVELIHKLNKKMSYRVELQYQYVPNDFGQWLYGLFEFNIAPNFSFAVSDMWNFKPDKTNVDPVYQVPHHFYSIFASYTKGANRFSLNYVKQVGGIVCTGGVCRYEPAFSGVKFAITSTF